MPPQASAGGPYTVLEGGTVTLDASQTTDINQAPSTLTYQWDLNGNGIFGETGAAATRGNEVGINPTFNAAGLSGSSVQTVQLKVTDSNGLSSIATATVNVVNVPPTVTVLAPSVDRLATSVVPPWSNVPATLTELLLLSDRSPPDCR